MLGEELLNAIPVSYTGGLSSAWQLVDTTANERCSFKDNTSETTVTFFYPLTLKEAEIKEKSDDQAWYWSAWWRAMEIEADKNLEEGDYEDFENLDDFIASL